MSAINLGTIRYNLAMLRGAAWTSPANAARSDLTGIRQGMEDIGTRGVASLQNARDGVGRFGDDTAGASLVATGALTSIVLGYQRLETAQATVIRMTGLTGEAADEMRDSFTRALARSDAPIEAIASVMGELNSRLGLTGTYLEDVTVAFDELADIAGENAAPMVTEVAKAMRDWGIESEDALTLMDKLALATQETGVSTTALTTALYTFGAPLRALGFSMDETIALFAGFDAAGVRAELVMGAFRYTIRQLAIAKSELPKSTLAMQEAQLKYDEAVKASGENSMEAKAALGALQEAQHLVAVGSAEDIPTALNLTIAAIKNAKTETEALTIATQFFGGRATTDMMMALREGRLDVDELTAALGTAGGTLETTGGEAEAMSERVMQAGNQLTILAAELAETLVPVLEDIIAAIGPLLEEVEKLSPEMKRLAVGALVAVAALSPLATVVSAILGGLQFLLGAVVGFAKFLGTILPTIKVIVAAFTMAKAGLTTFGAAFGVIVAAIGGPVTLIIAAIAAIGAAVFLIHRHWEGITDWFGNLLADVMALFKDNIGPFVAIFGVVLAAIGGPIALIIAAIVAIGAAAYVIYQNWEGIVAWFGRLWKDIQTVYTTSVAALRTAISGFGGWLAGIVNGIVTGVTDRANAIARNVASVWSGIQAAASTAWGAIRSTITTLWNGLVDSVRKRISDFTNIGRDIADGIRQGISDTWQSLVNRLTRLVNLLPRTVRDLLGISSPSQLFAEMFESVPAGMGLGIERGLPSLLAKMKGVTDSVVAAASGISADISLGTGQMAGAGAVNHYTIGGVTIDAASIREIQDVSEFFGNLVRKSRMG